MLNKKDGPYYKQIAELIKLQIEKGNLRPGEKLPSERELKEQYKVGRIIIRMALDILLKENLIEKKIGVGTFINRNLKIKIKRKHLVGVVLANLKGEYMNHILLGITSKLEKIGYNMLLKVSSDTSAKERKHINELLKKEVDGIIIFPVNNEKNIDLFKKLKQDKFPIIFIDLFIWIFYFIKTNYPF